jgi:hypothetical protein
MVPTANCSVSVPSHYGARECGTYRIIVDNIVALMSHWHQGPSIRPLKCVKCPYIRCRTSAGGTPLTVIILGTDGMPLVLLPQGHGPRHLGCEGSLAPVAPAQHCLGALRLLLTKRLCSRHIVSLWPGRKRTYN